MTVARIKRIRRIGDFRAFQSWADGGAAEDFKRVNLIYGTNGSGKSTLACLFQACANAAAPAGLDLRLDIDFNGTPGVVTESSPDFWGRVHVFNRSYVDDSLHFDDENGPSPDSLLTLGKENVANEKELSESIARRERVKKDLALERSQRDVSARQIETRLSGVAKTIVDELRQSQLHAYRGTNVYTKADVRARLDADRTVLEGASTDIAADIAQATAARMNPVSLPALPRLAGADAVARAQRLLEREVAVEVLEELRGHADRAAWVQAGLPLHSSLDACLFCGGDLTAARRRALSAHFDDAMQRLQASIDSEIADLQTAVALSKQYLDGFPTREQLYGDLAGPLAAAKLKYEAAHAAYEEAITALVAELRLKRGNPFQVSQLPAGFSVVPPSPTDIEAVVRSQRARSEAHVSEVKGAALRVELARVAEYADDYDLAKKQNDGRTDTIKELEDELRALNDRIATLENVSADPVPQAKDLTENVARLLGRDELRFVLAPDGLHYAIERNRRPARHLSEGERTSIALLHFLASIRKEVVTGDEPIVVIDDPVSSLDHEILFGASSFLWTGLVPATHLAQVFLLTHNFELFRQWIVQFERSRKEVAGGSSVHELRMHYVVSSDGGVCRVPRLEAWPHDEKLSGRLRSQYHFWFAHVARALLAATPDAGLAERMELLALAPNAARRMLEGFLSFRFPQQIGNFHGGMNAALEKVKDPALRNRVERYLHAYSHNEEGDISAMLDPGEATNIFRGLFELMKAVDPEHLAGMCAALEIDERQLLTVVGPLPRTATS